MMARFAVAQKEGAPGRPVPPVGFEDLAITTRRRPIREILVEYGIAPRKRLGQHFLHDRAVCARIVAAAGVHPGDRVLEIGPGLGALTEPLLAAGARVTAVEVDRRLAAYLRDSLGGDPGFELREADVLSLDPEEIAPEPTLLIGNLPYSITGPLFALILAAPDRFPRAVLMVQKEVGSRLVAGAGGKRLGAPAVLLRLLYRVRRLFEVGSGAFLPPPDVVSVVVVLERIPGASLAADLADAVNAAYLHRRKMIRKTLAGRWASEELLADALTGIGRSASARPEELEPEDWPRLLDAVRDARRAS
jgi:16S rRNA (adenine1518-N6/adenine1519-N6)-dimethyltransferase